MILIDNEIKTVDLAAVGGASVLDYTLAGGEHTRLYTAVVDLGIDDDQLSGNASTFYVWYTINALRMQETVQVDVAASVSALRVQLRNIPVKATETVSIRVESSDSGDTVIDTDAALFEQVRLSPDPSANDLLNIMEPQKLFDLNTEIDKVPRAASRVFRFRRTDALPLDSNILDLLIEEVS